jgi:hypothetical protein
VTIGVTVPWGRGIQSSMYADQLVRPGTFVSWPSALTMFHQSSTSSEGTVTANIPWWRPGRNTLGCMPSYCDGSIRLASPRGISTIESFMLRYPNE